MTFTVADYVIISIVTISCLIGFIRGLIKEAFSLVVWILAFWIAFSFADPISILLKQHLPEHPNALEVAYWIGFAALFISVLILGAFASYLLGLLVKRTGLSGTDRLLGLIFGLVRGLLVVSLLLLMATITTLSHSHWWQQSVTIPYLLPLVDWLQALLPTSIANYLNHFTAQAVKPT